MNKIVGLSGISVLAIHHVLYDDSLLSNVALEYTVGRIEENHDGLEFDGGHSILFCADGINSLGESLNRHTMKESAEMLLRQLVRRKPRTK
jgi:hypothetical protein